jgi:hypothetical protein
MFKKLFRKLKRFFKRIGEAFKELFTGEDPETVEAEIVTPKEKKKSEFFEWCGTIGSKIGNRIKHSIEEFADNPGIGLAKLTAFSAGLTVSLGVLEKIKRLFMTPVGKALEKREKMYDVYDHKWATHWRVNQPLTEEEKNRIILKCRTENIEVGDYLDKMGLLA